MARQNVNINFSQGLDTKTDPKQVQIGKFLKLQNSIFDEGGLLKKRNGFGLLTSLPNESFSYLTTLSGNLTAIGDSVAAYIDGSKTWVNKGNIAPMEISTLSLIKNSVNQIQCDALTSPNGLVCTVYTQTQSSYSSGVITYSYFYAIADSTTGQNIVEPTPIPPLSGGVIAGSPRIFLVGNYFVIVSTAKIVSSFFLHYSSISIDNPTVISPAQNVYPEAYTPASTVAWDGVVADIQNGSLIVAYNSTSGGQGIHVTYLNKGQIAANSPGSVVRAYSGVSDSATIVSVCVDTSDPTTPVFYVSFYDSTSTNGYTLAVTIGFGSINPVFGPQAIITGSPVSSLTSAAHNGICTVFDEVINAYIYDSLVPSHYVNAVTVTQAGVVGTPYVVIRSVGLASKAFIVNGVIYFLSAYQSKFQSSYFLINGSISTSSAPAPVGKLAYSNGGGYLATGLPQVSVSGETAQLAYLFKDSVQALAVTNPANNSTQQSSGGIYSQLGINLGTFVIGSKNIDSIEIASSLNLSGGMGWMYDGYLPVEQNFLVFPDSVEANYTAVSTKTPTGTFSSGSNSIVLSSATGVSPGMTITDTSNSSYIPAGTVVESVNGTTIIISALTTHSAAGDSLSIQGNIAAKPDNITNANAYAYIATYEWPDNNGLPYISTPSIPIFVTTTGSGTTGIITIHIPTDRLTYKIANPLKIVLYRWSAQNQSYFQVTSILAPVLNDTTIDYVTFVDTLPDSEIVGDSLLYTTGGVVPDCNPPGTNILTIWDTRVWLVDSENPSLLWLSKQVIQGTSVEWSQSLTFYVAPNIGTVSSSGPITALAPMDDKLIIFKGESIFYINGVNAGPDNTGANNQYGGPFFIASIVGCINQQSIVLTPGGLQFQTDKGIWLVGHDLNTSYVGAPVEEFNANTVNSAVSVPKTNQIRFTLSTGEMLMYDAYYGQWGTFNLSVPGAISSCIYKNMHTFINSFGQVYQETPGIYLDGDDPVLLSFLTGPINLAGLQGYQRIYEFYLLAEYLSPHKLNVQAIYDYNPSILHMKLIQPKNFNGITPSGFGIPVPFGGPSNLEQWRVHTKRQRCQSMQVGLTEVYDPTFGIVAGAGFAMSGIDLVLEIQRGWRPIAGSSSAGLQ